MTRVVYAVHADDPAVRAVHLMLRENIHRVVVVDERGALMRIVVPTDVLQVLVPEDESHVEFVDLRRLRGGTTTEARAGKSPEAQALRRQKKRSLAVRSAKSKNPWTLRPSTEQRCRGLLVAESRIPWMPPFR